MSGSVGRERNSREGVGCDEERWRGKTLRDSGCQEDRRGQTPGVAGRPGDSVGLSGRPGSGTATPR